MTIERTIKKVAYPQEVIPCEITIVRQDGEIIAAWDSVGAMLVEYPGGGNIFVMAAYFGTSSK